MTATEAWPEIYRATTVTAGDRMLWLAPWAEEFTLPPGSELVLRTTGGDIAALEIEHVEDRVVVWAPAAALISVEIDGADRSIGSAELSAPETEHLSTRAFLEIGLGDVPSGRVGGKSVPPRRPGWLKRFFNWV